MTQHNYFVTKADEGQSLVILTSSNDSKFPIISGIGWRGKPGKSNQRIIRTIVWKAVERGTPVTICRWIEAVLRGRSVKTTLMREKQGISSRSNHKYRSPHPRGMQITYFWLLGANSEGLQTSRMTDFVRSAHGVKRGINVVCIENKL